MSFSPLKLFPTTRLSRGFLYTRNRAVQRTARLLYGILEHPSCGVPQPPEIGGSHCNKAAQGPQRPGGRGTLHNHALDAQQHAAEQEPRNIPPHPQHRPGVDGAQAENQQIAAQRGDGRPHRPPKGDEEKVPPYIGDSPQRRCPEGGAAALLQSHILSSEIIAYEDLGAEAIRRLEVRDLPAIVVIDSQGNDLYATEKAKYRQKDVLGE